MFGIHNINARLIGSRQALEETGEEYGIPRNVIIAVFNDPYQILVEIIINKEGTGRASFVGRLAYDVEKAFDTVARWIEPSPMTHAFFPFPGNGSLGLQGTNVGKLIPGASPEDEAGSFALSLVSDNLNRSIDVLHDFMMMETFGTVFTLFGYEIWRSPFMKQHDFDMYLSFGVTVVGVVYPPAGKAIQGVLCASKLVELFQEITHIIEEAGIIRGEPLTDTAWETIGGNIEGVMRDGLSAIGSCAVALAKAPVKQKNLPAYNVRKDMGDGTFNLTVFASKAKYTSFELLKSHLRGPGAKSFGQFVWKVTTGAPEAEAQTGEQQALSIDMVDGLQDLYNGFIDSNLISQDSSVLPSERVLQAEANGTLTEESSRTLLAEMAPNQGI